MLHLTITGPRIFALLFALYPVIDVLASRICQKHRCIIDFACLFGVEALDLCLTVFEQSSGNLRCERLFALLKDGKAKVKGLYSEKTGKIYDATVLLADTGGKYVNYRVERKG